VNGCPAGSEIGLERWGKEDGDLLLLYKGAQTIIYAKVSSYHCHPALDKLLLQNVQGHLRPLEGSNRTPRDTQRANVCVTLLEESQWDIVAA
jgi:hypothetical protein